MTPKEFKDKFLGFALKSQEKTGIDAYVTLAQCALETGWGRFCPGNMMFGVKDFDGVNGNEQLVTTHEFSSSPNKTAKEIGLHTIESVTVNALQSKSAGRPIYKYVGKAYFRKYNTPEESFTDHSSIFLKVKAYSKAMAVKDDVQNFVTEMAKVYAQDPMYASKVLSIIKTIKAA